MRAFSGKVLASLGAAIGLAAGSAAFADMGRTAGSWSVSPSGAATYTIPLWVQPGPKGMQPSLAFSYNSQAGNGTMGVGWALTGFGSIERCRSTIGEDGVDAAIAATAADRFCINGNKLRITSGPLSSYGSQGAVYQTEIADFSRITSVGAAGTGPQSWIVHTKDGLIYEYGNTADSRVVYTGTTVYRWFLNKVSDRDGNSYVINYTTNNTVGRVPQSVSWGPTAAGGSTYQYQAYFNYSTKSNPKDVINVIEQGFTVPTAQRLDSVTIGYSASGSSYATKRQYILTYAASPTTGYSRLTQIKECAATTSNCLLPTVVTYQNGAAGVNSTPVTALTTTNNLILAGRYDFNGDGRNDLAYYDGSVWRVAFSNGNSISAGVSTGITSSSPPQAGRFLSNHQDAFVTGFGGIVSYVSYNGSSFTTTATGTSIPTGAILTDYNGDGLSDFIWASASSGPGGWTGTVYLKLNNSAGAVTVPTFDPTTYTPLVTNLGQFGGNVVMLPATRCPIERMCDINGDGRADQAIQLITTTNCNGGPGGCQPVNATYDLLTGYYGYYLANQSTATQSYLGLKFNDDNCTDTITPGSTVMRISSCGTGGDTTVNLPAQPLTVMDWDGDGRSDLVVRNGGTIGVYLSKGNSSSPFSSLTTTTIPYSAGCVYFSADVEGDGLDELACVRSASPYNVTFYTHKGGGSVGAGSGTAVFVTQVPDLMKSITDGYGVSVSPNYISLAQSNYTPGVNTVLPLVDANEALYAVGRMTVSDGIGGTYDLDYNYKGARRNSQLGARPSPYARDASNKPLSYKPESDGQWAGFEEVDVYDSRVSTKRSTSYEQLFPLAGMVKQTQSFQQDNSTILSVTKTNVAQPLDATANNQRYFTYVSQISTDSYEVGGALNGQLITSVQRTFGYTTFDYGNVATDTTVVTDKDAGSTPSQSGNTWTTAVTNSYAAPLTSGTDWCIGFVTQTDISQSSTASGVAPVTRTTALAPDGTAPSKCRVSSKTTEPSSSQYKVVETYGYDAFGNVNSIQLVGRQPNGSGGFGDMPARTSLIDWGTTGQFAVKVTDAVGGIAKFAYNQDDGTLKDSFDQNSTDLNVIKTSFLYDGFARVIRETKPNGTYTTTSYDNCSTAGCANALHVVTVSESDFDDSGTMITDRFVYEDAMGRPLVTRNRLLNGASWDGTYQWAESEYDSMGRLSKEYFPCATTNPTATCRSAVKVNVYDLSGRVTQVTRPRTQTDATVQTTQFIYAGRTQTTIDPQNRSTTRILNVDSTVRQIKDANNYAINFTYDAAGGLIRVADSDGLTRLSSVTINYGIRPFQVEATESAHGHYTRTYNSLGEMVSWTDAKGQSFSATYDPLSRPLTRDEPDSTTRTAWTWGNDPGQFNQGQLVHVQATAAGSTYMEDYVYDNRARLQGWTISIPSDGTYTYNYAYDPHRGWLDTLTYPVSSAGYRLGLKYSYQNGVLQTVADANAPSTVFWSANTSNARGQLTTATLGNGLVSVKSFDAVTGRLSSIQTGTSTNPTSIQNLSYLYDLVGNLTQRQNNKLGLTETFVYGSGTDNLYRLDHSTLDNGSTSFTNLSLSYDSAGNMLTKNEVGLSDPMAPQTISWTSFNYPAQIVVGSQSATFSYGQDRQRWRMTLNDGTSQETTFYIGGALEKVSSGGQTNYRHTIFGGDGPVAIYSRSSAGVNILRYLLGDHQASTESFVEDGNATVTNSSFSTYGSRRNAATWSGDPTNRSTLDGITRQGYTFQTSLSGMGMNDMSGRVEDSITGRFLSPDPFVTQPLLTQNYNRYSYAYNNPATLVDPSGFGVECSLPVDLYRTVTYGGEIQVQDEHGNWVTQHSSYQNGSITAGSYTDCHWVEDPPIIIPPPFLPESAFDLSDRDKCELAVDAWREGKSPEPHDPKEAGEFLANAGAAVDVAAEAEAGALKQAVKASETRIGRPPNSMRAPWPGTNGPPSVQGWRATQSATAEILEGGGRALGAFGVGMDAYSGIENGVHGEYGQMSLDLSSAAAGTAMLISFEVTAPVSVPVIVAAKTAPHIARQQAISNCMGRPMPFIIPRF